MTESGAIPIENFSHVCIGVSDMETSLAFNTGLLGMDVVFDVALDGSSLGSVTGLTDGWVGCWAGRSAAPWSSCCRSALCPRYLPALIWATPTSPFGSAISRRSTRSCNSPGGALHAAGRHRGVRMLFVYDPDQTPIEFIELPEGVQGTLQMWRPPA